MTNRNLAIDLAKLTLALFVVGIHANLLQDTNGNIGYFLVNGVFRTAVPFFLIINGYFLQAALENGQFKAWSRRILLLYGVWMLAYLPAWLFSGKEGSATILHRLLFGYHHLWYLAGIIGAAAIIWKIHNAPTSFGCILATIALLVGVAMQYAGAYHLFDSALDKALNYNWSHRNFLLLAFPFMYVGLCIRKFNLSARISYNRLLAIFILGATLLAAEVAVNQRHGAGTNGFDNLLSLALICPAMTLLALRSTKSHSASSLSALSSGIYLIHPAILLFLAPLPLNSTLSFLSASVLATISALILIQIKQRFSFIL